MSVTSAGDSSPYPSLNAALRRRPPARLFHYTSSSGLLGIAATKALWATHVRYLNDMAELSHAVDLARRLIDSHLEQRARTDVDAPDEEILLREMRRYLGSASTGIYVASLTEAMDHLSQWRAYCPPAGGYALGISSEQLAAVAAEQRFFLAPCVYDKTTQRSILSEIIAHYLSLLARDTHVATSGHEQRIKNLGVAFAREVSKYGAIIKHPSFREEREWRVISFARGVNDPHLRYRPGKHSIVPYLELRLQTAANPHLLREAHPDSLLAVTGPTVDPSAANFAVQSLGHNAFPPGWAFTTSGIPYRGY